MRVVKLPLFSYFLMKHLLLLLLVLLAVSGSLLAQTFTLSASTFYLGDAPGSYTLACPNGSSARVTALTKITDLPASLLPAQPITQAANGTVFQAATGNTGQQVYVNTLPQSATGAGFYNVGVLSGTYACYAAQTGTPPVAFTVTLAAISRADLKAQKTWALKASSVKLPQLTTAEQTTLPPQQAGNVVYNTDQQKLAIHNGTAWQYISPTEASQFRHGKLYNYSTTWTVPTSVTQILAEVWGGGAGGMIYAYYGNELRANGGGAGGYGIGYMDVTPGQTLTLTVGAGGRGASRTANTAATNGSNTFVETPSPGGLLLGDPGFIDAGYGGSGGVSTVNNAGFTVAGGSGSPATISYGQKSATEYILLIQCGNGGSAYSAPPGGFGTQIASLNSSVLLYQSGDNLYSQRGSFPGGGGGCGYNVGGDGSRGMIVLHW